MSRNAACPSRLSAERKTTKKLRFSCSRPCASGVSKLAKAASFASATASGELAAIRLAIANAVGAKRLMMLTDVVGVLDKKGKLIAEMPLRKAKALLKNGTIDGGMIPKVNTCLNAIEGDVEGAVIIDGRVEHAILIELFTEGGAGTLITRG